MDITSRKGSLLSIEVTRKSLGTSSVKSDSSPKDTFYVCRILFFFIGFMQIMPLLFLGSAANYWFYKFRNTTQTESGSETRSELQTLYQSCSTVAQTIPSLLFMFLTTKYGHKIHPKPLTVANLVGLIAIFSTFAIFTQVDTDTWQMGFFITTMLLLGANSAVVASFQLSSVVIVAKFPYSYLKYYLFGQSGTIISNILLVASVAITDYQPTAAAIYFGVGVLLIAATLALLLLAEFTEPYKMYVTEAGGSEKTGTQKLSWSEGIEVLKKIWPSSVLLVQLFLAISCIHPSVDTLVVSEFDAEKTVWTETYFVYVITFLLADASGILGRICSFKQKITRSNYPAWLIGGLIRCIVSIVFVMLCNAQPRHHLPVVFNHDWQYILFVIIFSFTSGYLFNVVFLSLDELSGNQSETSLKLTNIVFTVTMSIFCANGILMVKLL